MANRVPEGPPPAPVVQRLRIRYAKRGRLRFTSSRDFQRALERALRRADVPIAYSAGFHPHPKISYANAAATGTASEAEYVELSLAERREPEQVRAALDEALPDGLDIEQVVEAEAGALADRLQASTWRLHFAAADGAGVGDAFDQLQQADRVEVTRMMKTGPRTFDVRAAIRSIETAQSGDDAVVTMVLEHVTPAVRPQDVLTAVAELAGLRPDRPPLITRLNQGPLGDDGSVRDPLMAEDRS